MSKSAKCFRRFLSESAKCSALRKEIDDSHPPLPSLAASIISSSFLFSVIIGNHKVGMLQHEVISSEQTPFVISITQHNHLVCLGKYMVIALLFCQVPTAALSSEWHNSYQLQIRKAGFEGKNFLR